MRKLVREILVEVEEYYYDSVVIPAIGTDYLKFPKEKFAQILFEQILEHLDQSPNTRIRKIRLTNNDLPTVSCIMKEFLKQFGD